MLTSPMPAFLMRDEFALRQVRWCTVSRRRDRMYRPSLVVLLAVFATVLNAGCQGLLGFDRQRVDSAPAQVPVSGAPVMAAAVPRDAGPDAAPSIDGDAGFPVDASVPVGDAGALAGLQ